MNVFEGTNIGSPNIFAGFEIGSPNSFTGNSTTIYPPQDSVDPLFGRLTPEFGRTEAIFGED